MTSLGGIVQLAAGSQGTFALGAAVWCWGNFATPGAPGLDVATSEPTRVPEPW